MGADAQLQAIHNPEGWDNVYFPWDKQHPEILWETVNSGFNLQPGESARFSFSSTLAPSLQTYQLMNSDETWKTSGKIASPKASVVPSPASSLPLIKTPALTPTPEKFRGTITPQSPPPPFITATINPQTNDPIERKNLEIIKILIIIALSTLLVLVVVLRWSRKR